MFGITTKDSKSLKIIIVGCGKVGMDLVTKLREEEHSITVVDKDPQVVAELSGSQDILAITGNGATYSVLQEAGVAEADLLIAVTDSDELNVLTCVIAGQNGNCATIARVRQPEYEEDTRFLKDKLGLQMIINPDQQAAREATRMLSFPAAIEIDYFSHERVQIVKIAVTEEMGISGYNLAALNKRFGLDILVCCVERGDEVIIPGGSFVIQAGDKISVLGERQTARKFFKALGVNIKAVRDCTIVGGGRCAYYLAKRLRSRDIDVKIIEINKERAEQLADLLTDVVVINADGTSEQKLKEEGIEFTDSFVPLTGIDEENVLLTLYARKVSSAKTITKINRVNYKDVITDLDLGSVLYPKALTTEAILGYVRVKAKMKARSDIENLYSLYDEKVEAIEFVVSEESAITGKKLMELKLKKNTLIGCIYRDGSIIIPGGNDFIRVGDSVTIITANKGFGDINDILSGDK